MGGALAPAAIEAGAALWKIAGVAFSRRTLLLLILGLMWVVPAFRDRRFLYGMLIWDAIVTVLWLADLATLPRPQRLLLRRRWHGALSLSVDQQVEITITNDSKCALTVSVTD